METAGALGKETAESECDAQFEDANNQILKTFIETYETLPELWDVSSPLYVNKSKRNAALSKLLVLYKMMKPNATVADVRKKINTLRSNCRRELNKIKASKRTGTGTDNIYTPTSWVFYALSFLHDVKVPVSPMNEEDEVSTKEMTETSMESHDESQATSLSSLRQPSVKKHKPLGLIAKQNQLLTLVCQYLSNTTGTEPESEKNQYLQLAKVWATKLEGLDPMQRKFAEKAINDVLFEADLGTLHRNSVKINSDSHNLNGNRSSSSLSDMSSSIEIQRNTIPENTDAASLH